MQKYKIFVIVFCLCDTLLAITFWISHRCDVNLRNQVFLMAFCWEKIWQFESVVVVVYYLTAWSTCSHGWTDFSRIVETNKMLLGFAKSNFKICEEWHGLSRNFTLIFYQNQSIWPCHGQPGFLVEIIDILQFLASLLARCWVHCWFHYEVHFCSD